MSTGSRGSEAYGRCWSLFLSVSVSSDRRPGAAQRELLVAPVPLSPVAAAAVVTMGTLMALPHAAGGVPRATGALSGDAPGVPSICTSLCTERGERPLLTPAAAPPGPGGCREGPGGTEVAGPERAAWRVGLIPPPNAPVAAGRQPAAVGGKQSAPKPRGQQRGAGSPRAVPRDGARPEGLQHRALPGLAAVPGGVGAELVPTGSGQGRTRAASPTATAKRPAMLGGRAGRM